MTQSAPFTWGQVQALFDEALARPPGARAALLADACAGQPELRREVESLLAAYERAERAEALTSPFATGSRPAPRGGPDASRVGQVVGSYRLGEVIGRGGMGVVHVAEHVDPRLSRRAAVKLLRRDVRPDDQRRFLEEQRILSRLEHPNIARLMDAGVTDDGAPFLIMEYVDGTPLIEHCRTRDLGVPERLELFEAVCAAVQYAHSHLVVHRDLKPSNILVDLDGRPRLLDFGIAKLLDTPEEESLTRTGQHLLTPEYASPEQFRGEPATTQSDVYSLGVVLYELLCGRRPHRLEGLSAAEAMRVVSEDAPPRPSTTGVTTRTRREDLDVVLMTALAKDAGRRYASVAQFADDLRRLRLGLPILARAETLSYRLAALARRHRGFLTASALVALAAVIGWVTTARQAAETRVRFQQVRSLANTMLFDTQREIRDQPGLTHLRERLVAQAATHLAGLAEDARNDPSLREELAAAYEQLGELRGDPEYASLGDLAGAIASYTSAESLRAALFAAAPHDAARARALAEVRARIAAAESWNGDNDAAIRQGEPALAALDSLARLQPADTSLVLEAAEVRSKRGWFLIWGGDLDGGIAETDHALRSIDTLLARHAGELELELARADAEYYRSDGLKFAGRYAEMVPRLVTVEDQLTALAARHPGHVRVVRKQVASLLQLGEAYEVVDPPRALETYARAVAIAEPHYLRDHDNAAALRQLAGARRQLGGAYLDQRRPAEAAAALERAVQDNRELFARDAANNAAGGSLATSLTWLAQSRTLLRQHEAAAASAAEAVQVRAKLHARLHGDVASLANLASARAGLGDVLRGKGTDTATPRAERREAWARARGEYAAAESLLTDIQRRGKLMEYWTSTLEISRRGRAAADSAIAALR